MRRLLKRLIWPILAGIILAVGLLMFFPQLGSRSIFKAPSDGNQNVVPPSILAPTREAPVEEISRPAPKIRTAPPVSRQGGPVSYAEGVERAAPAVVNIYSSRIVESEQHPLMSDPFFRQFFGDDMPQRQRMLSSLGSGVIVSDSGYVLTNQHVISGADQIQVALRDGRETLATVIGTDVESDLAVLHIELDDIPVIALSDSEKTEVGDVVLAIGNPFGVGQTVTMGIVSATGRNHLGLNAYEDFIQTDAAINPGNSGGALVNPEGAMVGINTAIFSRSGGSQGIGFAIPANLARDILDQLVTQGRVIRGWLGVEARQMTQELATSFGLKALGGVAITRVVPNGPADKAGLKSGDVLLKINDRFLVDARAVMADIAEIPPGTQLPLRILRDGERQEIVLTVGERPKPRAENRTQD
ncbi:Do family serine endopeptidase [Pistricoccus aurantiacus]|uniref:Do family serine endopeptidase n=1 Tax=Pistricoccus aurantiacus TaxID=1883414 RepID=UPI00364381B4